MREPLKINKKYKLKNKDCCRNFYITSLVGYGATCIVYEAYYLDDDDIRHIVRLKECYPISECNECRDVNDVICWENEAAKEQAFLAFEKAYKRHSTIQMQLDFVNVTSKIVDCMYEGNNTKYIVMECDNGMSFEKAANLSLYEKLKILKALANTVNKYHEIGWLHLDLKPENFMIIKETSELVKLFDFDSLISMDAVQERRVTTLSFSGDWAAPEVKQRKLSKIGPASDVYSIGAILYYMIFNEKLDVNTKLRYGNYFSKGISPLDDVNPVLIRLVGEFLNNTLAASSLKRYTDMNIVVEKLTEMIHYADPSYAYLNSCLPPQTQYYYGREQEFNTAKEILNKGKLLIVSGMGGVGKSEFALNFAHRSVENYDCIIWGKCGNKSLEDFLLDKNIFSISNIDQGNAEEQERSGYICDLLTSRTLLVIDDVNDFEDEFLQYILQSNADIIITTRINVEDYFADALIICLNCMEIDALKNIFYHYYERQCEADSDIYIEKLIKRFDNYTLLVPMLAKQIKVSSYTPKTMWEMINEKGIGTKFSERIVGNKDQKIRKDYFYNHVKEIFDLSQFGENEKRILLALSLIDDLTIEKATFARWCSPDYCAKKELRENNTIKADCSEINDLIESGWIMYDGKLNNIYLHDVIREVILYELKPGYDNTPVFLSNLLEIIEEIFEGLYGIGSYLYDDYSYTRDHVTWYYTLAVKVLRNLDVNNPQNDKYIIDLLELFDNVQKGLTFANGMLILIDAIENQNSLSENYRLKLQEWGWDINISTISDQSIELSEILKKAIDIGNSIADWGNVTVYANKHSYFHSLYWFIYKFAPEDRDSYRDFVDSFVGLPDGKEIVLYLKELLNYSLEHCSENYKTRCMEYLSYLDDIEHIMKNTKYEDAEDSSREGERDKNDLEENSPDILEQISQHIMESNRMSNNMKIYLMAAVLRFQELRSTEKNEMFYLKEICPQLCFPFEDSWEYLRTELYNKEFQISDIHSKIWEMCELGAVLNDLKVYFNFSEATEQVEDMLEKSFGIDRNTILASLESMKADFRRRSMNAYLLIKEIQEFCVENNDFWYNSPEFWDDFIMQLLLSGCANAFLRYIEKYCDLVEEVIIPDTDVISFDRDSHLVQLLISCDMKLFALKVLLDIINYIENKVNDSDDVSVLQSYYEHATYLACETDNAEIYYQIKEKLRRLTNIQIGYTDSGKFSSNSVNTVELLNSYIHAILTADSDLLRNMIAEKLSNEKQLDANTCMILRGALEEKVSLLNVLLSDKNIPAGFVGDEELLAECISDYSSNEECSNSEKIKMLSEICLQAIVLEQKDVLDEYVEQYISLQERLFSKDIDPLELMSYMALPQIICKNIEGKYAISIFKSLDQKLTNYSENEKGKVEKVLSLPYLCFMYDFLERNEKNNETWSYKNSYYSKVYKALEE